MYNAFVAVGALFLVIAAMLPYIIARQRNSLHNNWIRKIHPLFLLCGTFGSIFIPNHFLNLYFGSIGLIWIVSLLCSIFDVKQELSHK